MLNGRKQGCYNIFFSLFANMKTFVKKKSIQFLLTNRITLTYAFCQTLCCLLRSPFGRLHFLYFLCLGLRCVLKDIYQLPLSLFTVLYLSWIFMQAEIAGE